MNEDYAKREHARRDSTSITSRDLNSDHKSWHGMLPDVDSTKKHRNYYLGMQWNVNKWFNMYMYLPTILQVNNFNTWSIFVVASLPQELHVGLGFHQTRELCRFNNWGRFQSKPATAGGPLSRIEKKWSDTHLAPINGWESEYGLGWRELPYGPRGPVLSFFVFSIDRGPSWKSVQGKKIIDKMHKISKLSG